MRKLLDQFQSKELADNEKNVTENLKFVLGMVENTLGKGENAGTSIFSFSQNVFKMILSLSQYKSRLCLKELWAIYSPVIRASALIRLL